jgi:hypothetical protein
VPGAIQVTLVADRSTTRQPVVGQLWATMSGVWR